MRLWHQGTWPSAHFCTLLEAGSCQKLGFVVLFLSHKCGPGEDPCSLLLGATEPLHTCGRAVPSSEPVPGPCTTVGKTPASFLVLRLLQSWELGALHLSRAGAPGGLKAVRLQSALICVLSSLEELQKAPAPWNFPVL